MNTDGSHLRRLTFNPKADREPSWSPDGTKIVFIRVDDIGSLSGDIYVMNADGSREQFLTKGGNPRWSPDGTKIAFHKQDITGYQAELDATVWVMNADGSHQREVATNAADPAWLPDGHTIAYGGLDKKKITNVITVSADSLKPNTNKSQVTRDPVFACQPDVSPNGRYVAYIAIGHQLPHLEMIDIDGRGKPRHLTHTLVESEFSPSWSPDGTVIAIERDPDVDPHYANVAGVAVQQGTRPSVIVLVAADGSRETILSGGSFSYADPAFAPRGP